MVGIRCIRWLLFLDSIPNFGGFSNVSSSFFDDWVHNAIQKKIWMRPSVGKAPQEKCWKCGITWIGNYKHYEVLASLTL